MPKTISCCIAAIRKKNDSLEILLCKPVNAGFYGMGFLKGQMEPNETKLEAAKREFSEESGGLDVELLDENIFFIQNNPKKKIFIWPAIVSITEKNKNKINGKGEVPDHDKENVLVKFYSIYDLPPVFRNQQKILNDLLEFIEENKDKLI